ncbi:hypothetical protein AMES_2109 [Amycolatopsis mediterranei S699]|uniref:Immunity protein Imm1 n=2 Tax=Amycolatopsis mediterranei TaxID=33910 RepID=A0A0H3CZ69_AMYMU|nr:Imm1 family immunity protein [Amycolatopsis mediterranei]ADJ43932.1 hypothetical protein AMED_2127 [Amycolatopsis mediterranei U32]AEK40654.1 hypothetical protein RAM_10820 [Amycolatopsis mediterranei S699]AFO75645.1 hypothetical protein AMES_2109 [Amycolatopsis mediterranei S699]AGT82774.1 hypothetical protein B737_2110 [Amycolatopsis mediterranei RB]KDO04272.1 hypothetical protein DV26_44810 [Amycolatopsis mediterranei]
MVALDIWYRQAGPDNTHPEGATTTVDTVDELNNFIDEVLDETEGYAVPPMIQVAVSGDYNAPVLDVGLGPEYGFIQCLSADGGWSLGDAKCTGHVTYDYMAHAREIPANAEIPLEQVRVAMEQFLTTGTKPKAISWQQPADA